MILAPHFSPTYTLDARGHSVVVEQGSEADLRARAKNVLLCSKGFREDLPEFGIQSTLFRNPPLNIAAIQTEVQRWANLDASVTEHIVGLEVANREIDVAVSP